MRDLTVAYPNDLDASVLYAESIMDMHPWQMWTQDGAPAEGTIEAITVLENVLKYDKNHIGANHYYIHTVEASISPERALESADRLKTLVPAAGHLVHMPSHIYMHTGDYAGAVAANEAALEADRKYIEATKPSGMYPLMYYNHNLDFLASAAMMTGEFAVASRAADEVVANALAGVNDMPTLEPFAAKKMFVLLRFAKWDDMLQVPAPDPKLKMLTAVWHFGRGVAMAKKGNAAGADQEKAAYNTAKRTIPADAMWGLNKASAIFAVADAVLDARIWLAKKDLEQSIAAWKRGVSAQDKLAYDEPDDWYYPVRESLEAALLYAHRLDETERIFRQDMEHNPENPRTLFIEYQFYTITDDKDMSLVYRRRFSDGWEKADVDLKLDDY
jgi:tetratricopeptide (TPR) repeat protein